MIRFLFLTSTDEDKTLYNISISYVAAYIFYILQVYILEQKRTMNAINATRLDAFNLINQTNRFLFIWDTLTNKTSDGAIVSIKKEKFYYMSSNTNTAHDADVNTLKQIVEYVADEYDKILNCSDFSQCDENVYKLFVDLNIPKELKNCQYLLFLPMLHQNRRQHCMKLIHQMWFY